MRRPQRQRAAERPRRCRLKWPLNRLPRLSPRLSRYRRSRRLFQCRAPLHPNCRRQSPRRSRYRRSPLLHRVLHRVLHRSIRQLARHRRRCSRHSRRHLPHCRVRVRAQSCRVRHVSVLRAVATCRSRHAQLRRRRPACRVVAPVATIAVARVVVARPAPSADRCPPAEPVAARASAVRWIRKPYRQTSSGR